MARRAPRNMPARMRAMSQPRPSSKPLSASQVARDLNRQVKSLGVAHGVTTGAMLRDLGAGETPVTRVREMKRGGQAFLTREVRGLGYGIINHDALTLLARSLPRILTEAAVRQSDFTVKLIRDIFRTEGWGTWEPNAPATIEKKDHAHVLRGLLQNPEPLSESVRVMAQSGVGLVPMQVEYHIGWDATPHWDPYGPRITMAGLAILHEYGFQDRSGAWVEERPILGLLPLARAESLAYHVAGVRQHMRVFSVPASFALGTAAVHTARTAGLRK